MSFIFTDSNDHDKEVEVFKLCKEWGVKHIKTSGFEVEFFEPTKKPEPMALDPLSLSKVLAEDMPPDSAMLFAATEDPVPESVNPISQPRETPDMT